MSIVEKHVSRRTFLKGTGALVVALGAPGLARAGALAGDPNADPTVGPALVDPKQIDSWLAVNGDGTVTMYTGKEELGTGTLTASIQMVADELDVAFDKVSFVEPDTWHTVDQSYSSGSQTLKTQFASGLRISAAEARLALLNLASTRLGVPVAQLTVSDGVVSGGGQAVSYAQLIGNQKFNVQITGKAKPKTPDQYKLVGTSQRRVDIPAKIYAKFTYMQDVRVPGMVHGRVVRPANPDPKLISVHGFEGGHPKGLIKVVVKNNFLGVVCEREEQAIVAQAAIKAQWQTTALPDSNTIYEQISNPLQASTDRTLIKTGNVDTAIANAKTSLSSTFLYPYQLHGMMGPSCAVADVGENTATVWSSTQGVYQLRGALATLLNLPAQNIRVIYVEGSGCYGLSGTDNAALDAALMSQSVGRPVRVQYMRADEHLLENFGSAMVMQARAGLDANGKIVGWDYATWSAGRGSRPGPPGNLPTGVAAGFPENPLAKSPLADPPLGIDSSNTATNYVFPNQRVVTHAVISRFFTGPLRSPARIQNTTANEMFMDELASAANQDPIQFRLAHLTDQRLIDVINTAAKLAKWETRARAKSYPSDQRLVTGRGIAAMQYEGVDAYGAVVVEVQVDRKTGKVTVQHVYGAQDCGLTVNPDGMRSQAEGCVMQGISRALKEEVRWQRNEVTTQDWVTYPVIRFNEMPTFDFQIVNRPDKPVVGAGEVMITAMPGAVGNAICDAIGVRLHQVPFTPARVRAAIGDSFSG